MKIRYLAERKKGAELQQCLRQMKEEQIYLSSKSKEVLAFLAGLKSLKTFPFKSMLVILGVFLMIAVFLFAERSGIQYTEKNRKVAYLSQEESGYGTDGCEITAEDLSGTS